MSVFVRSSTGPSSQSRWFERILPEKCVLFGNAFIQVCLILDSPSSVVFAIVELVDIPAEQKQILVRETDLRVCLVSVIV